MKGSKNGARAPKGIRPLLLIGVCTLLMGLGKEASGQEQHQTVRLATLKIDAAQLESYKAALKEEIETSVKIEPGVLTLYAVSDKDHPTLITIFEIYADEQAYNLHRESLHFKKYKDLTREMVQSLELREAVPLNLETKK